MPLYAQENLNKYIIDGFENPNPYKNYQVGKGDQSGLSLTASSERIEGRSSLEMIYYIKSTLPTGSYVRVEKYYDESDYLDLADIIKFNISVKGDGSGNIFKIVFIDGSDEEWFYENKGLLNSVKWSRVIINLSDLQIEELTKNDGIFNAESIKSYKIIVYNNQSKVLQGQAVKASQGKILVDDFYAVLKGMVEPPVEIEEKQVEIRKTKEIVEEKSPISFSGTLYGEYFHIPDRTYHLYGTTGKKTEVLHWGKFGFDATYNKVSAKMFIASEAQRFGDAAYRENEYDSHTGQIHQDYPEAVIPFIQLRVNDISDSLKNVTFGNLWFEYNRYTFSPTLGYDDIWGLEKVVPDWGYKGISAEGNITVLNYHAFFMKHSYESYTYGLRLNQHIDKVRVIEMDFADFRFYHVEANDTAKYTNDESIRQTGQDKVSAVETAFRFFDYTIGLEGMLAYNEYQKDAQVDYKDPYKPVFQKKLDKSIFQNDKAYKVKFILDSLFIKNFYTTYEYRYLGEYFKPKYRMEPILFDDSDSDQKGHNVQGTYRILGLQFTGTMDELKRLSNSKYYRKMRSGGVGLYRLRNIYLFYNYGWRRTYYQYYSSRSYFNTSSDDEVITQEIYVKTQLRYNLDLIVKLKHEDVKWPSENKEFNNQSIYVKSNFYFSNNLLLFAETRLTRFGDSAWHSPGYNPYIDNFVRAGTMFNF